MSKPAKVALAVVPAVLVLAIGGASFARSGGTGAEASGRGAGPEPPCGTTVTTGSGSDSVVAFTPCPGEEPPAFRPQVVEPTPGMADVHARSFDDAKVAGDDVLVDFVSGVEPCSVLDHVDVAYGTDTVTITLFEGHDPAAGQVACIDIGVFKRVVVTLDEPLGDRKIVDGAV